MFFKNYDLVVFDADGTVRDCTVSGQEYPIENDQWVLNPRMKNELLKYDF